MRRLIGASLLLVLLASAGCGLRTKVPPVANAGPDFRVEVGGPIVLDGSKSYDPDGGSMARYDWQIVGVPEGHEERLGEWLVEGNGEPVWTSPWVAAKGEKGEWVIRLHAIDEEGQEATDDLVIKIRP